MSDIELVIKIPEEVYTHLRNGGNIGASLLIENAIKNGTPLEPGHGKIVDVNDVLKQPYGDNWEVETAMHLATAIIEADR